MKQFAVALAAGLMALFLARGAQAAPMFSDVPSTHWAHDAVKALAEKGIIEGYPTPTEHQHHPAPGARPVRPKGEAPPPRTGTKRLPPRPVRPH